MRVMIKTKRTYGVEGLNSELTFFSLCYKFEIYNLQYFSAAVLAFLIFKTLLILKKQNWGFILMLLSYQLQTVVPNLIITR